MNLEPLVVDSIKERIVRSVWALGPLATKSAIGDCVTCDSSVLAIAINALHRDGYLHIRGAAGEYVVDETFAATLLLDRTPSQRPRAEPTAVVSQLQPVGVTMEKTKQCIKCVGSFAATDENFGKDKRTPDGLGKRCSTCDGRKKAAPKGNGKSAPRSKRPVEARRVIDKAVACGASMLQPQYIEHVVPADGEIRFRSHVNVGAGAVYSLHQGGDQITLSRAQLQVVLELAGSALKG